MAVMGVSRFERFFRAAAGLDVDKNDLRRYYEFIDAKLYDLLLIGQARAEANGRDIIEPPDLPITKGLQESIHQFRELNEEIEVEPILELLAAAATGPRRPRGHGREASRSRRAACPSRWLRPSGSCSRNGSTHRPSTGSGWSASSTCFCDPRRRPVRGRDPQMIRLCATLM